MKLIFIFIFIYEKKIYIMKFCYKVNSKDRRFLLIRLLRVIVHEFILLKSFSIDDLIIGVSCEGKTLS